MTIPSRRTLIGATVLLVVLAGTVASQSSIRASTVNAVTRIASLADGTPFKDSVPEWAKLAILRLHQQSIVRGYEDGRYGAADPVTRGQVATLLYRILRQTNLMSVAPSKCQRYFDDIAAGHYSEIPLCALKKENLIQETFRFDPDTPATRGATAVLIERALGQTLMQAMGISDQEVKTGGQIYSDVSVDSYAYKAITIMKHAGLMTGLSAEKFGPDQKLNRAEVAIIIQRILDAIEEYDVKKITLPPHSSSAGARASRPAIINDPMEPGQANAQASSIGAMDAGAAMSASASASVQVHEGPADATSSTANQLQTVMQSSAANSIAAKSAASKAASSMKGTKSDVSSKAGIASGKSSSATFSLQGASSAKSTASSAKSSSVAAVAPAYPDYTVENISITPTSPMLGNILELHAEIRNIGGANGSTAFARLRVDGALGGAMIVLQPITSGASTSVDWMNYYLNLTYTPNISWVPTVGRHTFEICVNQDGSSFSENILTNNCATVAADFFPVYGYEGTSGAGLPDYSIAEFTFPASVTMNESFNVHYAIQNDGVTPQAFTFADLFIDNKSVNWNLVLPTEQGTVRPFDRPRVTGMGSFNSFTWAATPGVHTIRLCVNLDSRSFAESNIANNCVSKSITVSGN